MSVRSEIETKLLNWAKAQTPVVPVAIQNAPFNKPSTGGYLQIFFLDSITTNPDVSAARERETGIFQINVCQREGAGMKATEALIGSMKALFPVLPKTGTVSIERPPKVSMPFNRDDGFVVTYLSFSYRQER